MDPLFATLEHFGTRVALIEEDGTSIDFATFARMADEAVRTLAGERCLVAIEASNELEPLLAFVGACRAGCPVILTEAGSSARDSRIRDVFTPAFEYLKTEGAWRLRPPSQGPSQQTRPELHPELAVLLSTSGSTGSPKLVRLSRQNVASNASSIAEYLELSPSDRAITAMPLYYSYGMSVVTSHLLSGASICLTSASVMTDDFWRQFDAHGATSFAGVPRSFEILEHSGFLERRIEKLRHFTQAGGRLAPDKVRTFAEYARKNGARFYVMYGQTEAAPRMSYLPPEQAAEHPDCIGVPIPGGSFRLIDPDGCEVTEPERTGELCYRGPNVMMGYALAADDLAEGSVSPELRTGDLARKTHAGLYKLVGRANRFVKISGLRVGLDDAEAVLRNLGIEASLAGDDRLVAVATTSVDRTELAASALVERFGLPRSSVSVRRYDELPLLSTGKPDHQSILRTAHDDLSARAFHGKATNAGSLRSELAAVLGRTELEDHEAFIEAGGDSLNYVEASRVVEEYFGRAVDGWEKLPMVDLERAESSAASRIGPSDSLLVTRAVAVALATLSHFFGAFGIWGQLPDELRLVTRTATPSFLVLTGLILARSYSKRLNQTSFGDLFGRFLPMAITVYGVFGLVQLCGLLGGQMSWERAVGAVAFVNIGQNANILLVYSILFLLVPFLLATFQKLRSLGLVLVVTIAWTTWYLLRGAGDPGFTLGFLAGAGNHVGPSVLQGLTFVVFGYALGTSRQGRGELAVAATLAGGAAVLLGATLWSNGVDGFVEGIASMDLRRQNHPIYYAFGVLGALGVLGVSQLLTRLQARRTKQSVFNALGANSLFAYGFGCMLLNLTPRGEIPLLYGIPAAFCFIALLAMLTFDVSQKNSRLLGAVSAALRRPR